MILGMVVTGPLMVAGGLTLFVLIVFQVLVGLRKINLGRKRLVIHKWTGITILALAAVHGLLGIAFGLGLVIL